MQIKLWAEKGVLGLLWVGTTHEEDDMTRSGYAEITTVNINISEQEVHEKIEYLEREKLIAKRNTLMKQLEEVEAKL